MNQIRNLKKNNPKVLFAICLIIGLIALLAIDVTILSWRL